MNNLSFREPQNTQNTQKMDFMEKLLGLPAGRQGGVEVEWKAEIEGSVV